MTGSLKDRAIDIWRAGVNAVDSGQLVQNAVSVQGGSLTVAGHEFDLSAVSRIVVVGAGKAGAGMAAAIEERLPGELLEQHGVGELTGWVNVPEDCVRPLSRIRLHSARPAGANEPTPDGVEGSDRILELIRSLTESDLGLVLLSGGGSALLPAPAPGISLGDLQEITRLLMHGGATINELNCVRKQPSRIKGGRLAASASAGPVVSLIISDVIGDPLDVIASGPTVDDSSTPAQAIGVLERGVEDRSRIPESVLKWLRQQADSGQPPARIDSSRIFNHVIGNNSVAVEAALARASQWGFRVINGGSDQAGVAADQGREIARECLEIRDHQDPVPPPACVISGGEPVVHLVETDQPRQGGRNQELVLAAAERLQNEDPQGIAILSGGTDGEDGPTDAAGAVLTAEVLAEAKRQGLDPSGFLAINDSYGFFDRVGGLLKTGPTHTNVMDLRVAVVES